MSEQAGTVSPTAIMLIRTLPPFFAASKSGGGGGEMNGEWWRRQLQAGKGSVRNPD
jgi:hypothetical protein